MAKTLILYFSSHGNTEKIVKEIQAQLREPCDLAPIKGFKVSKLAEYDRIALGGSIHAGRMQKQVKAFAEKNTSVLATKPLALFVGCLDKEKPVEYIEATFPPELVAHATLKTGVGGDVVIENLPGFMRMIMKKITPTEDMRHSPNAEGREALKKFLEG
ncbi:MAG: hypothetical protein JW760_05525 [Spirochaetales bacterium]|nr:hypothetical protein [Spirochaetales bacterium]